MDKLAAMTAFAKVVALGSYAEAGRHLGLTRSAVSKAVMELEQVLGAPARPHDAAGEPDGGRPRLLRALPRHPRLRRGDGTAGLAAARGAAAAS